MDGPVLIVIVKHKLDLKFRLKFRLKFSIVPCVFGPVCRFSLTCGFHDFNQLELGTSLNMARPFF